ncbi:TPA: nucleotide pyrophosphohydrolase [Legionella pneumophila]|nr:nucleotide pyrophosphohydrolase [Legionella pneumophila]
MAIFEEIEQLEQEAAAFGLQWETKEQIMTQIRNECLEIEEHLHFPEQRDALQDEIGDLLHAVFSLCVFSNFSPELTLRKSLDKFEHRLNAMKDIAKEQGLSHLREKSFDELMQYWQQAKARTKLTQQGMVRGTKKALDIWESRVTQKELILKNVWCGQCRSACTINDPVATIVGNSIVLNGNCATCGGKVARYIEES